MELKTGKFIELLKKYRYAILVLLIGLVLITLPSTKDSKTTVNKIENAPITEQISTQQQLSELLSKVEGAGAVEVMLTVAEGEEIVYQENSDSSTGENTNNLRIDTVTVTDADRNEKGLICQTIPPKYLGAVILCQGADDPVVKLAIVDAVSKITGLGANCISVLKMR